MNSLSSANFPQNQTLQPPSQGMRLRSGRVVPHSVKHVKKRIPHPQPSLQETQEKLSLYKLHDNVKGVVGSFLCLKDTIELAKVSKKFNATHNKFVNNDASVSEILRKAKGKISAIPEPLRSRVKEIAHSINSLDLDLLPLAEDDVKEFITYFKNSTAAQYFSIFKLALQDVLQENSKDEKIKILQRAIKALSVENSQLKALLLKVMLAVEEDNDLQSVVDSVLGTYRVTTFTDSMRQTHLLIKRLSRNDEFFNIHFQEARRLLKDADEGECLFRLTSHMATATDGQIVITVKRSDLTSRDETNGFFEEVFDITDKGELLCDDETSPFQGRFKDPNEILQAFNLKLKHNQH